MGRQRKPKHCPMCGETDLSKFGPNKARYDGLQIYCRECKSHENVKYLYGLTPEQYKGMLEAQKGLCALCGEPPRTGHYGKLVVDHDHDTQEVRALVHQACNAVIGYSYEDPRLLLAAVEYLHKYKKTTTIASL